MNRQIKFRGKRIDNGEWVYGYYVLLEDYFRKPINGKERITHRIYSGSADTCTSENGYDFSASWYDVNPNTVGQYTGLHDKNGKEIYEGDILRYPPKDEIEVNNYVSYEVFWHDNDCANMHIGWQMNRYHYHGNLCGTINDFTTCLPKCTEKMIIIGNIHDKPELMEGGRNGR